MNKGDKVFPQAMQRCMATETVIVKVCEFFGSWSLHTKSHMAGKFAEVAELRVGQLLVIKVVELVGYFFGYIATTFFIANEPELCMPRSITIKIIDLIFDYFIFEQHNRKDNKWQPLLTRNCNAVLLSSSTGVR